MNEQLKNENLPDQDLSMRAACAESVHPLCNEHFTHTPLIPYNFINDSFISSHNSNFIRRYGRL